MNQETELSIEDGRDVFSKYLDNGDQTGDREIYRIDEIKVIKFRGSEDKHIVLTLTDGTTRRQQPFRLNKTNYKALSTMFGHKLSEWKHKKVILQKERSTHKKAKNGLCLRVYGSPDIERDISLTDPSATGIGKARTLVAIKQEKK